MPRKSALRGKLLLLDDLELTDDLEVGEPDQGNVEEAALTKS